MQNISIDGVCPNAHHLSANQLWNIIRLMAMQGLKTAPMRTLLREKVSYKTVAVRGE